MKHIIHLGENPVVLVYKPIERDIDTDSLTAIDYSNIYGEVVTTPVILNMIGQLRAEAEKVHEDKKIERKVMEADLEKRWRREANKASGKFTLTDDDGTIYSIKLTDNAIKAALNSDKGVIICMNNEVKAKRDLGYLDALYWAIKSKDQKLNNLLPKVTPEEFYNELVDGIINGILIKKVKR